MNLIGQRFGRLTVQTYSNRPGYAVCKCDCGNVKEVRVDALTRHYKPVRSCGCLRNEAASVTGKNEGMANFAKNNALTIKYGTNVGIFKHKRPRKNNSSGHVGVYFNEDKNRYEAYISFQRKRYALGTYTTLEAAVSARENAEKVIDAELAEAYAEVS